MANPFDQFDAQQGQQRANPFDRFDGPAKPILGTDPWDAPTSLLRGINQGIAQLVSAPYQVLDWAGEKLLGTDALPDVGKMSAWQGVLNPPAPKSRLGDYAQASGNAIGGSVIPTGVALGLAGRAAGPAATTTMGQIGQNIVQSARANPASFVAMDAAGSVTGGAAQQAAADAGAGPGWQTLAGIAGGMVPGVAAGYRAPSGQAVGSPTAQGIARQRYDAAVADTAAFDAQGVRPFGPSFNQGPVASVAKQLTETPLVGAPLRNNLDETIVDAGAAVRRLADDISPNATMEQAGTNLQRGLDRYRSQGLDELEPGVVQGLGINPQTQNIRQQVGGQAQLQRIGQNQGAIQQITGGTVQNSRGQPVPLPTTRAQRYSVRTSVDDLTDNELTTVIRAPSDTTSFGARSEALYERAWRNIPDLRTSNGRANANLLPTANAGNVVRGIVQNETRTGVRSGLQGRYGDMFETLSNPSANTTLDTLRQMRTQIGRDLSNFGMYDATLDRTQLRQLYGGLSSDIEIGLQDIAARAAQATRQGGNNGLSVADARRAVQALRDFQVADRYFRQGIDRMDRFAQIVRAENPQAAAAGMIRAATDGSRGNMRMFRAAMSTLRPEERSQFGALIVREMGAPTPGARGVVQEAEFSPNRFVTNYAAMSPEARALLFSPNHQRALDELFRISNRISNVEALTNTSRSGTNALNLGGLATAIGTGFAGDMVTPIVIGASGYLTSLMMSTPQYTRWMTQYLRLRAAISDGSSRSMAPLVRHIMGLEDQARYNPELWPVFGVLAQQHGIEQKDKR